MIMLIDLSNLAHRVFHTPQGELCTSTNEPSGVILGTLNSMKGYLDKFPETERVIVCFDGGKSRWRKSLYPNYKGQRDYGKDDPEKAERYRGLWKQIDTLYEFFPSLGVDVCKIDGQEADDLIACVCRMLPNEHKLIISSDKDMYQLIDENTSVYSQYKDKVISPLNFYEEMKITKEAWIGYRSLLGDDSDNISGIPGVGEKTAKSLMDTYGHIDNILNARGADREKLLKNFRTRKIFEQQNLQLLGLNNKLMNFKYAEYGAMEPVIGDMLAMKPTLDTKAVQEFLKRWQFVSILSNYMPWILPFKAL